MAIKTVKKEEKGYFVGFAFNGGGVRGVASTAAIRYIEEQLGCHLSQVSDLMGGTSTGGILSCALTFPNEDGTPKLWGKEITELYHKECATIFKKTGWQKVKTGFGVFGSEFPLTNMIATFKKYFGDTTLDKALCPMFTTAWDCYNAKNFFFKSEKAKESELDNHTFVDAMCSTAAAPTYFPPHQFETKKVKHLMADGGVSSLNNPSMALYAEAKKLGYQDDKIIIINIGTGASQKKLDDKTKKWGIYKWVKPVIDIQMDGANDATKHYLKQILPEENLYIWDFEVPEHLRPMDGVKNIPQLEELGWQAVHNQKELLDKAIKRIKEVKQLKGTPAKDKGDY